MYFGSDNQTGASDQVINALLQANDGVTAAYAEDKYSQQAVEALNQAFETDADIYFVSTGTAANSLALATLTQPWDSVVCHGQAHIINDELTAPEFFTGGARLIGIDAQEPKLTVDGLEALLANGAAHPPHNSEPKVLSLTQMNESGQIYSIDELKAVCDLAHRYGLKVHMDGARFSNALVALGCSAAELSWKVGVDVLSLGATKNGALSAEAVIFFDKSMSGTFIQHRKRSGHLISKSRWLGAQFLGWLENGHWLELAQHANSMCANLAKVINEYDAATTVWPVQGNELFAIMSKSDIERVRKEGAVFYEWPSQFLPANLSVSSDQDVVRFVTSFRTQHHDIEKFAEILNQQT